MLPKNVQSCPSGFIVAHPELPMLRQSCPSVLPKHFGTRFLKMPAEIADVA